MNNLNLANESVNAPWARKPTFAAPGAPLGSDPQFGSRKVGWRSQESWGLVSGLLPIRELLSSKLFGGSMSWEASPYECVANLRESEDSDAPGRLGYSTGLSRARPSSLDRVIGLGSFVNVTIRRVTSR